MKFLGFIFLLFFTKLAFGQFSIMFNDTLNPFGPGGYDLDCVCEDDSFYYVLGGVNNYEPYWSNMVIKFDRNFQIVNKRKYIDTNWRYANYPYNTIVVNESQILTCPQIFINQVTFGKIVCIDKNSLDTLWTKIIAHPDTAIANQPGSNQFSDLTAIKQTPDGGYILTGNYNKDCIVANMRSFLLKIDSMGTIEWRRTYANYYTFYDIEVAADSGYFVPSSNNMSGPLIVSKFDKYGVFQWKVFVNVNANSSYPMDVSIDNNYLYVVSAYWKDYSNNLRAITLAKVDVSNHIKLWEKNYYLFHSLQCQSLHQAIGVEALPNGDIVVSGTVRKYGNDYSGFLFKLNSNGDSLWAKTYNFSTAATAKCQLNDMLPTKDGGFLGVGYYYTYTASTAWMFKTDKNGTVGFENTPFESLRAHGGKIYPNPALDYTTLSYNCRFENMTYSIVDINGRVLYSHQLETIEAAETNEVLIDLQSLSPGNYQIIIKSNDLILWTEKLIITE